VDCLNVDVWLNRRIDLVGAIIKMIEAHNKQLQAQKERACQLPGHYVLSMFSGFDY